VWCSPLFCNGLAEQFPANEWCLVDDLERAILLARRLAADEFAVEPGPYLIVEVLTQVREAPHI
jgi:hypothetical protein